MLNTWKESSFFTVAVFVLSMLDYFVLFVSEQGPCYWQLVLDECCLGVQKAKKQSASIELRTCNNILTLAQVKSQYNPCLLVAGDKKCVSFCSIPDSCACLLTAITSKSTLFLWWEEDIYTLMERKSETCPSSSCSFHRVKHKSLSEQL